MSKHKQDLVRSVKNAVIGFIIFALTALALQWAYYRFMPPEWFLNYYYVRVADAPLGVDVPFTVCRTKRYPNLNIKAGRTFFRIESDGRDAPAGGYYFDAQIEDGEKCQNIHIAKSRQPQVAGTYKVYTEAEFFVNGQRKVITYDSNEYRINDTQKSLEDRIRELETELQDLKDRLSKLIVVENSVRESTVAQGSTAELDRTETTHPQTSSPPATSGGSSPPATTNNPAPTDGNIFLVPEPVENLLNWTGLTKGL